MTDVAAGIVYDEICKLDMFKNVKIADLDEAVKSGLIEYVSDDVYVKYAGSLFYAIRTVDGRYVWGDLDDGKYVFYAECLRCV